jgi:endonuclease/exonuclease/phosphatase family metal-dependent hydrolase
VHVGEDHLTEIRYFNEHCAKPMPTLVVGDFNEGTDGPAVEYLEAHGFRNALPLFRPGQFTWRHGSLGNQLNETIDHVLFDASVAPLNAYVLTQGNSDHLPVVAHFEAAQEWPEVEIVPQASEALPPGE